MRRIGRVNLRFLGLALVFASVVYAVHSTAVADTNITVDVEPTSGTIEDSFTIQVGFTGDDASAIEAPIIPSDDNFSVEPAGTVTSHSLVNGKRTSTLGYNYSLTPQPNLSPGTYKIPQGTFQYNGKKYLLKQPTVRILKVGSEDAEPKAKGLSFVQVTDNTAPYVGQQVLYKAEVAAEGNVAEAALGDIDFDGFWSESFGKAKEMDRTIGNVRTKIFTIREALFPVKAGDLTIPARSITAKLRVRRQRPERRDPWGMFNDPMLGLDVFDFGAHDMVPTRAVAKAITVTAKPLPDSPDQSVKYVPVGRVVMASKLDKNEVAKGDSINLMIELHGDANLRPLELTYPKGLSEHFRIYPEEPKVKTTPDGDTVMFTKTFSLALVAQTIGDVEIAPFRVLVFDPIRESYSWLTSDRHKVTVSPGVGGNSLVVAGQSSTPVEVPDQRAPVNLLGEDLLPQHVGPSTYQPRPQAGPMHYFLLAFIPVIAIGVRLYVSRLSRFLADPLLLKQLKAYENFMKSLDTKDVQSTNGVDPLAESFRQFLRSRLRATPGTVTANEAAELVLKHLQDKTLSERVRKLLGEFERNRFGGIASGGERSAQLLTEAKDLARIIDVKCGRPAR